MRCGPALLLLCLAMPAAGAQPARAAEPILRVKVDPPRIVVGQSAVLSVDVLAPNYMTKPPVMPDFQLRNAVTRAGSTTNMSEQHDGITYAGVRFEFLIYPQEPGSYAVAGQKVSITYAAEPPATRDAELPVPRIALEAFVPDRARTLDPFVSATALKLKQEVRRSSEALKVGDAVTRTVTVEAEGTPSMLLPPTVFAAIDGTKLYPAQPDLQDKVDRRTDRLSSTRTDEATYMLERSGELSLPAVEVAWWNVQENRIERARAEPVVLQVADNPALKTGVDSRRVSPPSSSIDADLRCRSLVVGPDDPRGIGRARLGGARSCSRAARMEQEAPSGIPGVRALRFCQPQGRSAFQRRRQKLFRVVGLAATLRSHGANPHRWCIQGSGARSGSRSRDCDNRATPVWP